MFQQAQMPQDRFIIEELIYVPVGQYNPVYNRPYVVNTNDAAVNMLAERMLENRKTTLSGDILGGLTSQFIQPNAKGLDTVVNNNWVTTGRFIFMLKVRTIDMLGGETISYFQGYTEYDGITNLGTVDPQMVHYINSVIETAVLTFNTPLGVSVKEKIHKHYNVLHSSGYEELFTLRPNDITENMSAMNIANMMSYSGDYVDTTYMGNYMNNFDNKTIGSSTSNNIGTEYLANVVNNGVLDTKARDIYLGGDGSVSNSSEVRHIEPSLSDNRFARYISRAEGFRTVREMFSFAQLGNLDPTIYDRFKLIQINRNLRDPNLATTPDNGDFWHGQDPVTVKAYSIIENSVGLATKYGFNKLYFIASNMTGPAAGTDIYITNFNSFINLDQQDFNYLLEMFKSKFVTDVFMSESFGGSVPLHIEMYVDLLGSTKLNLSYAGYQPNWYTIPTFANSLFNPITTPSKQEVEYTTTQMYNVIDALTNLNQTVNNRVHY